MKSLSLNIVTDINVLFTKIKNDYSHEQTYESYLFTMIAVPRRLQLCSN